MGGNEASRTAGHDRGGGLGAGVVAVLAVLNWGTVCDHVEAWRFQLTREAKTITPDRHRRGGRALPCRVVIVTRRSPVGRDHRGEDRVALVVAVRGECSREGR